MNSPNISSDFLVVHVFLFSCMHLQQLTFMGALKKRPTAGQIAPKVWKTSSLRSLKRPSCTNNYETSLSQKWPRKLCDEANTLRPPCLRPKIMISNMFQFMWWPFIKPAQVTTQYIFLRIWGNLSATLRSTSTSYSQQSVYSARFSISPLMSTPVIWRKPFSQRA